MPVIIPSPEYVKRRNLKKEREKFLEALREYEKGRATLIIKKEIDLKDENEINKIIETINILEEKGLLEEIHIIKDNRSLDLIELRKNGKEENKNIKEIAYRMSLIINDLIKVIEKLKK